MATSQKATQDANAFESMMSMNPDAFKQGYEKFSDSMAIFADFNKGAVETLMTSAGAFAQGVETITAAQTEFVKSSFENTVAASKSIAGAKSVQEAFDVQSQLARDVVETNLGQVNKVAELWAETSKETIAPLTERYSEMVEKIQSFRP